MIRFGPSGNDKFFYSLGNKSTRETFKYLKNLGLNAFEYSFGRGNFLSTETALEFGKEASRCGIEVSVHAPYYINMANPDDKFAYSASAFLLNSLRAVKNMNGSRVVFHTGSVLKQERKVAFELVKKRLADFMQEFYDNSFEGFYLCPETMGKHSYIGSADEIFELCNIDKAIIPAFDFGHINCLMQGGLNSEKAFKELLERAIEKIGYEKIKVCHIHFSQIEYGEKGEIRHLTFEDNVFGPKFEHLAPVLSDLKLTPVVICESAGTQSADAVKMRDLYINGMKNK